MIRIFWSSASIRSVVAAGSLANEVWIWVIVKMLARTASMGLLAEASIDESSLISTR